ncbi:MAG: protein-glutamate O-methyltransferase CheR [Sphingobium sp.]
MSAMPAHLAFRSVATFFEERTGQHLAAARMWRVESALRNVMRENGLADMSELVAAIERDESGRIATATIDSISNNESSFFRDAHIFTTLEEEVLPHLNAALPDRTLRIWCAGCSTGQEAWSLAILLNRHREMWRDWRISIVGTDVSPDAVARARAGLYGRVDAQRGLPVAELLCSFEPVGDQWRIAPHLRGETRFHVDNLLDPRAVPGRFDLILCRNVLLYFSPTVRSLALSRIADRARPDTLLLLGAGETMIGTGAPFVPSGDFRGFYRATTTRG